MLPVKVLKREIERGEGEEETRVEEEERWGGLCWTTNRGAVTISLPRRCLQPSAVRHCSSILLQFSTIQMPYFTLYSPYSFVQNAANLIMTDIPPSVSKGGGIKLPTASDCRSS